MLDYSQIKSGKFRKNITRFDIREAIKQVMDMQRARAQELGLDFFSTFLNIAETDSEAVLGLRSPFVYTDMGRVNQVLLGL